MSHKNNGKCDHCRSIFDLYPEFHSGLRRWFEELQAEHPEAHISCAGRGRASQAAALRTGASRAKFGKSAHNYNAALDIFELAGDLKNLYEHGWYEKVLAKLIPSWINWYGAPGSSFFEQGHVEVRAWRDLVAKGELKLVEEKSDAA